MFSVGTQSDLRNSRTAPKCEPSRSKKYRPCVSVRSLGWPLNSSASLESGCFLSVLRKVVNGWPPTFSCTTGEAWRHKDYSFTSGLFLPSCFVLTCPENTHLIHEWIKITALKRTDDVWAAYPNMLLLKERLRFCHFKDIGKEECTAFTLQEAFSRLAYCRLMVNSLYIIFLD